MGESGGETWRNENKVDVKQGVMSNAGENSRKTLIRADTNTMIAINDLPAFLFNIWAIKYNLYYGKNNRRTIFGGIKTK